MNEKVIHYRFFERVSKKLSHVGGLTVVYAVTGGGLDAVLEFAFSECSLKDSYCKRTGVALAAGRLANKKDFYKSVPLEGILKELFVLLNVKGLCAEVDITKFVRPRVFQGVIDVYVDQYLEVLYGGKYYGATLSDKER
jgi:hypothetical protein